MRRVTGGAATTNTTTNDTEAGNEENGQRLKWPTEEWPLFGCVPSNSDVGVGSTFPDGDR